MKREIGAGVIGFGAGLATAWIYNMLSKMIPSDHQALLSHITFIPPMPEAEVEWVLAYIGRERFKNNVKPTPHTGWVIVEKLPPTHHSQPNLYNAIAFVDLWTITEEGFTPKIYTLEIAKVERGWPPYTENPVKFRVFQREFGIAPTATAVDTSGRSPGYWLTQIKETGEMGEFL